MKILQLQVDTTRDEVTDFLGQRYGGGVQAVAGDTILIAAKFQEVDIITSALGAMDLTGALALRAVVGLDRQTDTDVVAFQDVYNSGQVPAFEDASIGQITWLLDLSGPEIETELDVNESTELVLELTLLTPDNLPQTLMQLNLTVFAQIDDGAVGVPPPAASYMTAATALATFVALPDYLVPETIDDTDSPYSLASIAGLKVLLCDTSAGDITVDLPAASTSDAEFSPLVINVGTGEVTVSPDGTAPDSINGAAGDQTIVAQYGSLRLFNDPSNDQYLAPNFVVP